MPSKPCSATAAFSRRAPLSSQSAQSFWSSGASIRVGVTYYYYPNVACTFATCQLRVGFIKSSNGGTTWNAAIDVAGPMTMSWLPNTSQGRMVGDYISTSYNSSGLAFGFSSSPALILTFGFLYTAVSNVFSNAFHVY